MTKRGMPFRSAYKIAGQLVRLCIEKGVTLETLPLEEYRRMSELFQEDVYAETSLEACVARRTSQGGAAPQSVLAQIDALREAFAGA